MSKQKINTKEIKNFFDLISYKRINGLKNQDIFILKIC